MKKIFIPKQESAEALVLASAAALAKEIGWVADDKGNVKKDGIDMYFRFYVSGSQVTLTISNGITTIGNGTWAAFSTSSTYTLYVLKTANGSVAVGETVTGDNMEMGDVIAKNTAGEWVGLQGANGNYVRMIRTGENKTRQVNLSTNDASDVSTSIVKLPDIWGGCMFVDLYYVLSCPYKSTDRVFYIGGKYYRTAAVYANYGLLALPDSD